MDWSLLYKGEQRSLADWGISALKRQLRNQAADRVTFAVKSKGILDEPVFDANEYIKIYHGASIWFQGVVTMTPVYGSMDAEFHNYTLSGTWWFLENLIYQQVWKEPVDPDDPSSSLKNITKSHLILGQNSDGDAITIGDQIDEIVSYAIGACAVPILLDDQLDLPVNIPFDECKDLSCAEAIKKLLRWIPDAICYFDYSTDTPTLYIKTRSQLESVTFNILSQTDIAEFSIQPRYDLQVSSVVLKFEKTHSTDGKSWKTVQVQRCPISATGTELKSLVMAIELEGVQATYVKQYMKTEPIQIDSVAWWKAHLPGLQQVPTDSISISDQSRSSLLPNEIIQGNVADWMNRTVEQDVITAKISYQTTDESVYNRAVAVKLNATNATTYTYKRLTSLVTEEDVPLDLAEQVYNSVSVLQFDGFIRFSEKELSLAFMGKKLNLSGGQSVWNTMDAVVQEVNEDLDAGETRVVFGPARHLGADDLSELTRTNRTRFSSRNFGIRSTAEAEGSGFVEQGKFSRIENSSYGPGKYKKITFQDPEDSGKSMVLDVSTLPTDLLVKLREEDVSDSGVFKKRYSVASEPFVP